MIRNCLVQGNDESIEQIIQDMVQIKRAMGHMSMFTNALAGVRGDAQNQNKNLYDLAREMGLLQTRLQEVVEDRLRAALLC